MHISNEDGANLPAKTLFHERSVVHQCSFEKHQIFFSKLPPRLFFDPVLSIQSHMPGI